MPELLPNAQNNTRNEIDSVHGFTTLKWNQVPRTEHTLRLMRSNMRILRIYYFEYTLFEKLLVIAAVEKFIYRFPFPQPWPTPLWDSTYWSSYKFSGPVSCPVCCHVKRPTSNLDRLEYAIVCEKKGKKKGNCAPLSVICPSQENAVTSTPDISNPS